MQIKYNLDSSDRNDWPIVRLNVITDEDAARMTEEQNDWYFSNGGETNSIDDLPERDAPLTPSHNATGPNTIQYVAESTQLRGEARVNAVRSVTAQLAVPSNPRGAQNRMNAQRGAMLRKLKKQYAPYVAFDIDEASERTGLYPVDLQIYLERESQLPGAQIERVDAQRFQISSPFWRPTELVQNK